MASQIEIIKSLLQPLAQVWWIILPVVFYRLFFIIWDDFVKDEWSGRQEWTVIELIPPKDLEKGPKPMESIYHSLMGSVKSYHAVEEFVYGMDTDKFSFELVGLGGEVHFYIRVQKYLRVFLESQIYAQYPGIEIFEVPDYMQNFPKIAPNRDWKVWGSDLILTASDAIPIRTYDKFEEDITGTMIDPLAAYIELFASLPPGQNILIQHVVKPLPEAWIKKEKKLIEKLAGRTSTSSKSIWQHLIEVFVHMPAGFLGLVEFPKETKKEQQPLAFRLTPGEQEQLKAIEENMGKTMYKVKMRFVYIGKKEGFDMANVGGFFGVMRQFGDLNLNTLKPDTTKTSAYFVNITARALAMKRRLFNRYRKRNTDGNNMIFSTSELATLYHIPDMGVMTPALPRVESKKGTAPSNLPIG